ncbi:MAG: Hsp20/alpha crystallin family protein [Acidimicrobiia bacterium]|nr:Hsp20/alpha crystallin family protein [Acidimicrobiia bacterium]
MARFVDPFEEMDRMLATAGTRWRGGVMPLDAYEKDGQYILRFDIPGVDRSKIDVMVEDRVLTVKAERSMEDTVGANWMLRERPTGVHSRQVRLGDSLDVNNVSADYNDGTLTIAIPVKEEAKPQKITIETHKHEALEAAST